MCSLSQLITSLVAKGGPDAGDYSGLNLLLEREHRNRFTVCNGLASLSDPSQDLERIFSENHSIFRTTATMQGFARSKPHGYSGDFEIIERIYNQYCSESAGLRKWDEFFHQGHASRAVRNRADVLVRLVGELRSKSLCSLGAGSGLDVLDLIASDIGIESVVMVDNDRNAVTRASENIMPLLYNRNNCSIQFICKNVLRFNSLTKLDFIWSAGLFDYLNDKTAIFLLKRIREMLKESGLAAIGNFDLNNPSRPYMEIIGEWFLIHRSKDDLFRLAMAAGFEKDKCEVISDDTHVNLFLLARV